MKYFACDAELYCEDCARKYIIPQTRAGFPEKMNAEEKREYNQMIRDGWVNPREEWDSPEHCASREDCVNAIMVGEHKIGAWLENRLTSDGLKYVKEVIRERDGLCWELWAECYREELGLRIVG